MKTLYFDCGMGFDGSKIAGSLMGLVEDRDSVIVELNDLSIPSITYSYEKDSSFGNKLLINIEKNNSNQESDLNTILSYIDRLKFSSILKNDIYNIINSIEEAKKSVYHNLVKEDDYFHEANRLQILAEIIAVCYMIRKIDPDMIGSTPVPMDNLSPAASYLLRGAKVSIDGHTGVHCSLSGAAIITYYVKEYGVLPPMTLIAAGYGIEDKKDEDKINYFTSYLGESENQRDQISLLYANLDDMTGEEIGFAQEMIWESGALDVYTTSIFMKKNRPAVMLTCICKEEKKEECIDAFFRYTSTLGVRMEKMEREVLERKITRRETPYGHVRVKNNIYDGQRRKKLEYDDLKVIARNKKISLKEASKLLKEDK